MPLKTRILGLLILGALIGLCSTAVGQLRAGRRPMSFTGPVDRGSVPTWPLRPGFEKDVFTFARVKYSSSRAERSSFAWWTDYPDADLNLSYRLHQLTSVEVNPEPRIVEITDPELFDYPWTFMSGAGNIVLTDEEARTLRKYLLNGGFLMIDDFWGRREWEGVYRAMKEVLPDREPVDLPRSHPLFHCLYNLPDDLPLQTPNVRAAVSNRDTGITWEDGHAGGDTQDIHFRAIFDDKGRIMVLICHNTDNGDGWEEEGSDPWYFTEYSEKRVYPLGFNIVFYIMTH